MKTMHTRSLLSAFAGVLMAVTVVSAADIFPVEYVAGHANVKQQHGGLVVVGDVLRFTNDGGVLYVKHVKTIFEIPLATIVSAVASTDTTHGVGAFSWNAVKSEDYVTITTESEHGTEALVFKVEKKQAAGVAAKITFAVKKAKAD